MALDAATDQRAVVDLGNTGHFRDLSGGPIVSRSGRFIGVRRIMGTLSSVSLVRRLAKELLSRSPYEIVPKWRLTQQYDLARHLQQMFDEFSIDCVIDVGANRGQFAKFLRANVGYGGWIVSFEPVAETFDVLRSSFVDDERFVALNYALGDAAGETEINVAADSAMSSFLPARNADIDLSNWSTVRRRELVQIRRMDDILPTIDQVQAARNRYLKLDTQGFDLQVIGGAQQTLKSVCALQSEVSVIPVYEGMPSWIASIEAFTRAGFDVSGMFPVTLDHKLRAVELDCVMINRAVAGPYEI